MSLARPLGLHNNHYVTSVSENDHNSGTTWHNLIKFCIEMHVNIIEPLTRISAFFDVQEFAEHHFSPLWSVSANGRNSLITWYIWIKFCICIHVNII